MGEGEENDEEEEEEEFEETEAGAEIRQICEKLVTDFKSKMHPHLADFRSRSRQNLSRDVCYTWAKMCKTPSRKTALKQKLTKSDKCLIAALTAVGKRKWNLALSKLKCAQGPDPDPKKKEEKKDEKKNETKDEKKNEKKNETKDEKKNEK